MLNILSSRLEYFNTNAQDYNRYQQTQVNLTTVLMLSISHLNPCREKVPFPILKNSGIQESITRKPSCPRILRIGNSKSTANILNTEHHRLVMSTKGNTQSQQDQNINLPQIRGETNIGYKRSVQTILGYNENLKILQKAVHTQSRQCLSKEPGSDAIDKAIRENNELTAELAQKQEELKRIQQSYYELEQKYIRLLEVTNERSESHVKILLEEGQSRLSKSKLKSSSVSDQAQKLKAKLEGLDISLIKTTKDKENSFKLSEVIIS